jgi:amino acid adenylation domain-containing protein
MKARKADILAFLQQQQPQSTIPRAVARPHYPLSFAQQRLWFLDQLDPGYAAYNMPFALSLRGSLNAEALAEALRFVVRRHHTLTTRFSDDQGEPVQYIQAVAVPELEHISLEHLPQAERLRQAQQIAQEDAEHCFQLAQGPLIRFRLLRLAENEHVLLLNMHHIVSDGWSIGIFIRETTQVYQQRLAGQPPQLPPLPIQYFDFATWQRNQGQTLIDQQREFWQRALQDTPTQLNLPVDKPRPSIASYRGAAQNLLISTAVYSKLKQLAQTENATPFMLFFTLYGLLLSRWCDQDDLILGTTVANRNRRELEPLIGFFVNTLPLRLQVAPKQSFRELLRQVKEHANQAFANGDMPFEQMIEMLDVPRDPARPPLVQAGFTLNMAAEQNTANLRDLELAPFEGLQGQHVKTELTLLMRETDAGISGMLAYSIDLFSANMMQTMADQFTTLAQTVAEHPDHPCQQLLDQAAIAAPEPQQSENAQFEALCKASNLSENQILIWLGQTLDPDDPSYHNTAIWHLRGKLDIDRFTAAFAATVNEADALRTTISETEGIPQRCVHDQIEGVPAFHDLRGQGLEGLQPLLAAQPGLQLDQRLFRCALCQLAEDHFVWLFTVHQMVGDGIAIRAVFETTAHHYSGATEPLPKKTFESFLTSTHSYFDSPRRAKDMAYFDAATADYPGRLPYYGQPFHGQLGQITRVHRQIATDTVDELVSALDSKATRDAALFNIFLTNLVIFLWRITQQTQITVGVPIHNRRGKGYKNTIGSFMHIVPIAVTIDPTENGLSLYQRLSRLLFEAMRHGRAVLKNDAKKPLYDVVLNYQTVAFPPFNDIDAETIWHHQGRGKTGLTIQLNDFGDSGNLRVDFEYHEAAFEAAMQEVAAEHFFTLLQGLMQSPDRKLGDLQLISLTEQSFLLRDHNRRTLEQADPLALVDLLQLQSKRRSEAIAVVDGEDQLSYGELEKRSRLLGYKLAELGVQAETPVGLLLEKSIDLIVAITAILRVGATYVPLNPAYPQQRLHDMISLARPGLILTNQAHGALADDSNVRTLMLDQPMEATPVSLSGPPSPDCIAYIIFTSGSTGQPKGVQISYAALANAFHGWAEDYQLEPDHAHLQMANFSFDVFSGDFVRALCSGGKLVLTHTDDLLQPELLLKIMREHSVTHAEFVPAVLRPLLAYLEETHSKLDFMEMVIAGSDKWTMAEYRQLQSLCGATTRVINSYGITEACIDSTWFQAGATHADHRGAIPIGGAFPNVRLYVLLADDALAPTGTPGELYIAGAGLARGYLDDPAKTASAFLPDPYGPPGGRRYRTGDLARRLPDGDIQFLGRADDQIKLRGFRIELGEIEARLTALDHIRSAAVLLHDEDGDKQLVAWLQPDAGSQQLDLAQVREQLKKQLPEHMIPSAWMILERMPLTPNGKIDRRALPAPDSATTAVAYVPARTPSETTIAEVWSEVLGRERIGINDNFFDLGGHSLKATQVVNRIAKALACDVPLRAIFEHPTVAQLAHALAASEQTHQAKILPADRSQPLPLSFAQQRLWFLDRLEGPSSAYNMPFAFRVALQLDADPFNACMTALIQRHENLRTTFPEVAGEAVQVIHPAKPFKVEMVDLSTAANAEAQLRKLVDQDAATPFDLAQGPLLRATLVRMPESQSAVLINIHHIVCDGWSTNLFLQEWQALYQSLANKTPVNLPKLSIQYADYAVWQREQLQGDRLEQQIDWWRDQLAGAPPLLELPSDHPRPAVQTTRGGVVRFTIDPKTTAKLRQLSQQHEATLAMTLMTTFAALLHRYSGEDDIVIGSPSANRQLPEIEPLIGFFANTLAFRIAVNPEQSFAATLAEVRQHSLDVYAHQETPFELLVDALKVPRSLSHNPIFQVMFVMQNAIASDREEADGMITRLTSEHDTAKFDLLLAVSEHSDSLSCAWEYHLDLFTHESAERMTQHFVHLLKAAVTAPQTSLEALPLTDSDSERQATMPSLKAPVLGLAELFEMQAGSKPNAPALGWERADGTYQQQSYDALNRRANQIAHSLIAAGLKTGDVVGICCERNSWLPAAVLGVIKAGAAYVPLDPNYPADRLQLMLDTSATSHVLCQAELCSALPSFKGDVLTLEENRIAGQPDTNPGVTCDADHLAYVIFTSGSTGTPKGVAMTRRVLENLIAWQQDQTFKGEADRTLQYTSLSFDVHFQEMFATWRSGGELLLISEEQRRDPHELLAFLKRHQVTRLFQPFVALNQLALSALEKPEAMPHLKRIITAGEQLQATPALRQWLQSMPQCRLANHYGPSETHVVTAYDLGEDPDDWCALPPIGSAIANAPALILDALLQLVPEGVPGELYIAEPAIARGYINQPALTAERFVPHPFGDSQRLYRTSDRVCVRQGLMHFLGRADQQVKLRGYRIEPGEIENVLAKLEAIEDAAVIVREDQPGRKYLAGYLRLKDGVSWDEAAECELRQQLMQRLPEYMVPSAYLVVDQFPLTPSGKLNRRALPQPQQRERQSEPPQTATEVQLAHIWSEVLGIGDIGREDHFFELGGHSLLATKVTSRLRSQLHIDLPLKDLFAAPQLWQLAARIDEAQAEGKAALEPIDRQAQRDRFPLSHNQRRMWFLNQLEPETAAYNLPAALRVEGAIDLTALQQAFEALIERHEILRTRFLQEDGEPYQLVLKTMPLPLRLEDLTHLSGAAQDQALETLLQKQASTPFDLSQDPLIRLCVAKLGDQHHVLSINMHHIISDGWSVGVLIREIATLYSAFASNKPSPLPELSLQYGDFAAWQQATFDQAEVQPHLQWWREALSDIPDHTELPLDHARREEGAVQSEAIAFELDRATTKGLQQLARQQGATLFTT